MSKSVKKDSENFVEQPKNYVVTRSYGKYLRRRVQKHPEGVSMTKQDQKDSCDINVILKRYAATGMLPDLIKSNPSYGDFSAVGDYQDSMNVVLFAQEQFAALSSRVRARFGNDPEQFLIFANDPSNQEEMVKLGLAIPREESRGKSEPRASSKGSNKESASAKGTPPAEADSDKG